MVASKIPPFMSGHCELDVYNLALPYRSYARYLMIVTMMLSGCSDVCENALVKSIGAPDGKRAAVVFTRDCGATSGFSTQISIVDSGEAPSGSGNVYIADDDHGAIADTDWHGPWAEVTWIGSHQLEIIYDPRSRVFLQSRDIGDIGIDYVAKEPPQIKSRNSSSTVR